MRKLLLALIAAVLCLPAQAGASTLQGKFLQQCSASNQLIKDDAIVNPGVPGGSDHWHTVQGGFMDANSTPGSLLAGPSNCVIKDNHTAYWMPAIVASDGSLVGASAFHSYYAANWLNTSALPGGKIQPPPFGLRMIAGDSKSTVPQSSDIIKFGCTAATWPDGTGTGLFTTIPTADKCPAGSGMRAMIAYPNCWNGRDLDSPDHKSHVAYNRTKFDSNGASLGQGCPDGWVGIPAVQAEFFFPAKAFGGRLDSDHGTDPPGHSMHADVMFAWQGQTIAELMKCVNDSARNSPSSPLCGQFTSSTSSWLPPLLGWANKVTYVQANGNPAAPPA